MNKSFPCPCGEPATWWDVDGRNPEEADFIAVCDKHIAGRWESFIPVGEPEE